MTGLPPWSHGKRFLQGSESLALKLSGEDLGGGAESCSDAVSLLVNRYPND